MVQNLISVIVPIYKVENYLEKCIQSVQEQTYTKVQIVLVDDGSTDSCGLLCDEMAQQDKRIKVIHKENGGLSDARNAGLEYSEGEFVFYLDGDDYLEKDALETLIKFQKEYSADIVVGNYFYSYDNHEDTAKCSCQTEVILNNYEAMEALVTGKIQNFAWGKLIKTEIAKKHLFPKGKLFEDNYWVHLVFADAEKVVVINKPVVHYVQRGDSISYTVSLKHLDIMEGWCARKLFLEKNYPELVESFLKNVAEVYINIAWLVLTRMKQDRKKAFRKMREYNKELQLQNFAKKETGEMICKLEKGNLFYMHAAVIEKIVKRI